MGVFVVVDVYPFLATLSDNTLLCLPSPALSLPPTPQRARSTLRLNFLDLDRCGRAQISRVFGLFALGLSCPVRFLAFPFSSELRREARLLVCSVLRFETLSLSFSAVRE